MADSTLSFVELLQRVPPLLSSCVGKDTEALRRLRLVSKDASKVALLAFNSYTLRLKGEAADTNVNGASMLCQTCLSELTVRLKLTGIYTPRTLLREFVHQVGAALSTLTLLDMCFENMGDSYRNKEALFEVIGQLLGSCPALKTVVVGPFNTLTLLGQLGNACPRLRSLSLDFGQGFAYFAKYALEQLPSMLPQVTSLQLPRIPSEYFLPDMSLNRSLISVEVPGFYMSTQDQWHALPPNLQHFSCFNCWVGPSASGSIKVVLGRLLSVTLVRDFYLSVNVLAQLLLAAPLLQHVHSVPPSEGNLHLWGRLDCDPSEVKASNMLLLLERMQAGLTVDAYFMVQPDTGESLLALLADFPCMPYATKCFFSSVGLADLSQLLRLFPNMQDLLLDSIMDDVGLQQLRVCTQLTSLELVTCNEITPLGVFDLCTHLPSLLHVSADDCPLLKQVDLEGCSKQLARNGMDVEMKFK